MSKLILGIDLGTTSIKTGVYTEKGVKLAEALREYSLITEGDFVEVACDTYWSSLSACLSELRETLEQQFNDICCIGFSVQGETLCLLDEHGEPVMNAIVWMDNRAEKQAEELKKVFTNEECYKITGQVSFESCWPAAKLLWIKQEQPELFRKTKWFVLLEDYIIYKLTGKIVTEGSLLTSTEYWNIKTKTYWKEMLDYIGISEKQLPQIKESGEIVSEILPSKAKEFSFSTDTIVCTGCLDQVAGAIGVGNIKSGIFSENIGAALAICVPTKELVYDKNQLMPVHYFGFPDTYMMHTFTTGGMCLRWFRDNFCANEILIQEATGIDSYHLMDKEAMKVPLGSDGLLTLPHLQGSMAPDVNLNASGVFFGMTLKHTKAHFIRSVMESLGYIICRNLEAIDDMGLEIDQIRTMGGGSKSDFWNQLKADITGKELILTQSSQDTACLGAAILAGTATGIFKDAKSACDTMIKIKKTYKPDLDNYKKYRYHYKKFKELFHSLEHVYQM